MYWLLKTEQYSGAIFAGNIGYIKHLSSLLIAKLAEFTFELSYLTIYLCVCPDMYITGYCTLGMSIAEPILSCN